MEVRIRSIVERAYDRFTTDKRKRIEMVKQGSNHDLGNRNPGVMGERAGERAQMQHWRVCTSLQNFART